MKTNERRPFLSANNFSNLRDDPVYPDKCDCKFK